MKKFVFWYRRFSDLDHLLPVTYILIKNGIKPENIILTDIDIDDSLRLINKDKKINFIKNKGIKLYRSIFANAILDFRNFIIKNNNYFFTKIFVYVFLRTINQMIYIYFVLKIKYYCLKYNRNSKFICDHGSSGIYLSLSKNCKKNNINLASLPHGLMLHNGLKDKSKNHIVFSSSGYYYPHFSEIVITDSESKKFYSKENNIKILGSVRYSKKWIKVLNEIYEKVNIFESDSKTKILLVLDKQGEHKKNNFIEYYDRKALFETIKLINKKDNIDLIIKLHPSMNKDTIPDLKDCKVVDSKSSINTFQLMKSADLILTLVSSALLDGLLLHKKLGILTYVTNFHSIVADRIKEINIRSLNDLEIFIDNNNLLNQKTIDHNILNFYSEIVSNENQNIELNYFKYLNN